MDKTDIVPMGLQHHSIVGVDNYPNDRYSLLITISGFIGISTYNPKLFLSGSTDNGILVKQDIWSMISNR